jgi:hypothetical protein
MHGINGEHDTSARKKVLQYSTNVRSIVPKEMDNKESETASRKTAFHVRTRLAPEENTQTRAISQFLLTG